MIGAMGGARSMSNRASSDKKQQEAPYLRL
jgi:hypothetical protein